MSAADDAILKAQREMDLVKIGRMPEGARVLAWLIYGAGGLEQPSFGLSDRDTNLAEGRRANARDIVNELRRIDEKLDTGLFRAVFEARFARATLTPSKKEQVNAG